MSDNLRTLEELSEQIGRAEERLRLALDVGMIGVWDWDIDTNKLVWDRRMHELFNLDQVFGSTFEDFAKLVHPEDLPTVNKCISDVIAKGGKFNCCYRLASDPHKVIRGIGRFTYSKSTGKPERFIGVCVENPRTEQRCLLDCPLAKKAHEQHHPGQLKLELEACAS